MRGKHHNRALQAVVLPGSSPHARGAPVLLPRDRHQAGIIPACAGSTVDTCIQHYLQRDHPRMRGEH